MAAKPVVTFSRSFDLDRSAGILSEDSAASIEVTLATDADVVQAITGNDPFPARPNGKIELGRVQLHAEAGKDIVFNAGKTKVGFRAAASTRSGIGIYDDAAEAMRALAIEETPGLILTPADGGAADRFLVLSWGYDVEGSAKGSHPLGALGSLSFGVEGRQGASYAVIHRFGANTGAHDVMRETAASWKLARHIQRADQLAPGTWLVAETEGQVAVQVAAQLGYDFTFVHEAKALGLTGDIGLKIDARARAVLGIEVSGRYAMAVGREDQTSKIRLRLFKLNKKGHSFGLNLAVGVKGITDALPDSVDDFVKAVFGVHGRQVVKDLLLIEQWTDPKKDLSDTAAALTTRSGLELLEETTGIDPKAKFNEARARLLGALRAWDDLPEDAAALAWRAIETKGNIPPGLISSPAVASAVQRLIGDGVIGRVQAFINDRLNLDGIRNAITSTDFEKIDGWLVRRLSQFLDQQLGFEKLDEIKNLVNAIVVKRQEVFAKAKKALDRRYSFEFAGAYSKTTAKTALLDVEFDLDSVPAGQLMRRVLGECNMDELLTTKVPGVTLHKALLSHGIESRSSIEVVLPFYSFKRDHINKSLAKVTAQDDGGRVLMYELDASDTVTVRNRLRSQLSVAAAFPVQPGSGIRLRSIDGLSWSYGYAAVQENMRRADLEAKVAPFVSKYMADRFAAGGESSLDTWFTDFDRAVEAVAQNGTNEFGDVILTLEVQGPARALQAWFRARSESELKQDSMMLSRRVQAALKELVPFYYLQDVDRLRQNASVAALLTWAAIPVSTSVRLADSVLHLDTDSDVFWNHVDPEIRRAMARSRRTTAALTHSLAGARKRLLEAGQTREAKFFTPEEAVDFQRLALTDTGETLLRALLQFESQVIREGTEALQEIQKFSRAAADATSRAVERLSEMGSSITEAFHGKLSPVYGSDAVRTLGSLVFLEASCALDATLRVERAKALLRIMVLKEQRSFRLSDYLMGSEPDMADVAIVQTLAS